jgi:hypothetical protein
MKYIGIHIDNSNFFKDIETLKNNGFNIEEVLTALKMFVVNIEDDERDSKLEKLKSFDFIESVEENIEYQLIDNYKLI